MFSAKKDENKFNPFTVGLDKKEPATKGTLDKIMGFFGRNKEQIKAKEKKDSVQ